jgi:hypothetical protein
MRAMRAPIGMDVGINERWCDSAQSIRVSYFLGGRHFQTKTEHEGTSSQERPRPSLTSFVGDVPKQGLASRACLLKKNSGYPLLLRWQVSTDDVWRRGCVLSKETPSSEILQCSGSISSSSTTSSRSEQ